MRIHLTAPANARRMGVFFLLAFLACAGQTPTEGGRVTPGEIPDNALRMLFIGNSLTYENDLPEVVAAMARVTNQARPPFVAMVAAPDFSLEDHWNAGSARSAITRQTWDFVVMQQGPSSLPENRVYLREWTERFAPLIRSAGAEPALYMVWPAESRPGDFPGVLDAYSRAAQAVSGVFLPAGQAWISAWALDADTPLYGPDRFHPSPTGTWLAALVIFSRLYDVSPDIVPADLGVPLFNIAEGTAVTLRAAAKDVLERW